MADCDYAKHMFDRNLEAVSKVFERFRYVHEWAGLSISLESSFTEEQMHLHPLNVNTHRIYRGIQIYDGFLNQLANSIEKYNKGIIMKNLV